MWTIGAVAVVLAYLVVCASTLDETLSLYGEPEVMEFKDGKVAAFSMQFDDSMETHAKFVIPELNKRGLVGTFFVNPGLERHQKHKDVWEQICPKFGHELANHTMHHRGAKDYEEADYEIGECSRYIWKLYPNKSKLLPWLGGGNTTWNITIGQVLELMDKYFLFAGFGFDIPDAAGTMGKPVDPEVLQRTVQELLLDPEVLQRTVQEFLPAAPRRTTICDERGTGRPVLYAQEALDEGKCGQVGFHGVGGDWLRASREGFIELLDYLAANRHDIWVRTTGDVYGYCQERDAVKSVAVSEASDTGFKLSIECDDAKVKTYGRPFVELYDEPLTVRVRVPESWSRFTVTQGEESQDCEATEVDGKRYAQFDVRPNRGPAAVSRAVE